MKEYDLLVPLTYNDGTPIEASKLQELQDKLLDQFGGVTYFPQPNAGLVTYRDEIVIYRVIATDVASARRFLSGLKERLKRELRQEDFLIVERDVAML